MEVANTEGEPTTKLTRRLFRDSADLVWMHVHLPFVRGLAHGTLAKCACFCPDPSPPHPPSLSPLPTSRIYRVGHAVTRA